MPVFLMISTHGVLSAFQMVNKMEGVNYEILVKQANISVDGMRMPFASHQEKGAQQIEATSVSLAGLPKPFKTGLGEVIFCSTGWNGDVIKLKISSGNLGLMKFLP